MRYQTRNGTILSIIPTMVSEAQPPSTTTAYASAQRGPRSQSKTSASPSAEAGALTRALNQVRTVGYAIENEEATV